ncbi:hypothetical protein ABEB36_007925 [Hypothenemus hampei]|uniref:THAP-type domain-containing protein n=1 Tax=Hypothenemus hampei TaxID=57062 RepID=A0ABD1E073_HYPHA
MGKCIVCGVDESEVPKLHYFPRNREKSQLWQEHLGINIQHDSLRNYRICSKHFSNSAYENLSALLLHKDALPLKFTVEHDKVDVQPETTGISETIVFSNAKEADKVVIPPASTSAFSKRSRIYRNIPDLEISTFSTRKKQLINIIRRKEDQLRKVKKLCKRRGNDLKKLSNLTDSNVVRNLFNNMPSVTAKFMMSQIKSYSAKSARGRRWDFEEKVLALTIFKRSPKCYRLLRSFVALPSKKHYCLCCEKCLSKLASILIYFR